MEDRVTCEDVKEGQKEEEIGKKYSKILSKMFRIIPEDMLIPVASYITNAITTEVRSLIVERKEE